MGSSPLPSSFYDRDPVVVAREILGKVLVTVVDGVPTRGVVVETEAYLAEGDSACHAARGRTPRNATMFGRPGLTYVYPIHGRVCMNLVTLPEGTPSAILLRAVEPLEGLEVMRVRRRRDAVHELTSGPAKLCEAFGVTRSLDGHDATAAGTLWLCEPASAELRGVEVVAGPRIGVSSAVELPLRFYDVTSRCVSPGRRRVRPA